MLKLQCVALCADIVSVFSHIFVFCLYLDHTCAHAVWAASESRLDFEIVDGPGLCSFRNGQL